MTAPPTPLDPRRRSRGALAVGAIVVLVMVVAGGGVLAGALNPAPISAGAGLCRNVAPDVGLDFRGTYGATPWAANPAQAVMLRNMGNGAAVADVFGDGALDVFMLGQLGQPNRLFRNQLPVTGKASFEDVTAQAGLANNGGSRIAAFADLDNDGDLDLVVINDYDGKAAGSTSPIYRNNGDGTFTDVTPNSGFDPVGYIVGGLSLADYDHDGLLDIYVSYWTMELGGDPSRPLVIKGQFPGRNALFRNLGDFRFQDVTAEVGLGELTQDSFASIFADFNRDGWPDLYIAIDHRPDFLFFNEGGHFVDVTRETGVGHVGNDMGLAVADLDSNGLIDLYSTNITDPDGQYGNTQGNTMLMPSQAPDGSIAYTDRASEMGIADSGWGWGTAFTDMNLDGHLDLYAAQGMTEFLATTSPDLAHQDARLFLGKGGMQFALAGGTGCDIPGDQRAVIPFDYNRDGAPDLLVTQVGWAAQLLENQTAGNGWLTVDLSRAGAQAAGARVTVTVGGSPTTQIALYGGSYLAGLPLELYFGLGEARRADDVTITWADGTTLDLGPVDGRQVLRVTPAGVQR